MDRAELQLMRKAAELPLKEALFLADRVCVASCSDEKWLDNQIAMCKEDEFYLWNTNSVGNTAFPAVYAPRPDQREFFRASFERFKKWIVTADPAEYERTQNKKFGISFTA